MTTFINIIHYCSGCILNVIKQENEVYIRTEHMIFSKCKKQWVQGQIKGNTKLNLTIRKQKKFYYVWQWMLANL